MTTLSLLHLQYLSPPANIRRILSSPTKCLPPAAAAAGRAIGSGAPPGKPRKLLDDSKIEPRGVMDFIEWSRDLIRPDGGPPRWFSPAECGLSRDVEAPPLLFFLPGIDGVGFGLIRHHQRLGKIFDVWCLHIPVMDRTPFEDLVEYVERTVKSEKSCLPKKPIYLVGESLGACIALAVAARNPDVDFVLVLANPATSFYNSHLQSLSAFLDVVPEPLHVTIPYFLSFITGNSMRMSLSNVDDKLSLQQAIAALPSSFSQMLPCLTFLADILPKESLFWKLTMLRVASSFANSRLHAVKAQTLILAGGRDQLLPSREEAERLCNALPNCRIRHFQDSGHNLLLEKETGRRIRIGIRRDGLWYLDRETAMIAAAVSGGPEAEAMLQHCRLGHLSFESLNRLEPELMKKVDRKELFCNACELGKHTRSTYRMIGLRSCEPFAIVHSDVWGPCPTTSSVLNIGDLSGFIGDLSEFSGCR